MIIELGVRGSAVRTVEDDQRFVGRSDRSEGRIGVIHEDLLVIQTVHDQEGAGDAIGEIGDAKIFYCTRPRRPSCRFQ